MSSELTDWSREYPIDTFHEAHDGPHPLDGSGSNIPVHIDLDDLPSTVSDSVRSFIRNGDDLDAPRGSPKPHFRSRSETVFAVACALAEAEVPLEQIASILMDSAYGVSASILEKPSPARYAMRQATNALQAMLSGWPDVDRNGHPRSTFRNMLLAIRRLGLAGEYDQFHRRKMLGGQMLQVFQGELSDDLCLVLRNVVIERFSFDPGKDNTIEATSYICLENSFHPIRDYLDGLKWDGSPRIEAWLNKYMGADDTALNRSIARIVLVAAVRRAREPGVKFDNILVLEGIQGTGKSSALQVLAGKDNFSDNDLLSLDAKQQMEALEGIWIYEIGELSGMNKTETNRVKAFASRQVDRGRPAYGRFREDRARQVIFVGTTNDDTYLRGPTGNRRFWPVKTASIDLGALESDRDQLWAEAAQIEREGASIALPPELWGLAAIEQNARMEESPWLDVLSRVAGEVSNGNERVSSDFIFTEYLVIPVERRQQYQMKQVASLMTKLGWSGPKTVKFRGASLRGYTRASGDLDRSARPPIPF